MAPRADDANPLTRLQGCHIRDEAVADSGRMSGGIVTFTNSTNSTSSGHGSPAPGKRAAGNGSAHRSPSPKAAFGERHTGSALQVALERQRAPVIPECDDNVEIPRPPIRRVRAFAGIVSGQACTNVRRHTRVVARWIPPASQDVDKPRGRRHETSTAMAVPREDTNDFG